MRHIIHKQKVILNIAKSDDALALQSSVSNMLRNDLSGSIEAIFNKAFPADKIIRIDSLRLNLGTINRQNFEQEFKSQFIAELTKSLATEKDSIVRKENAEEISSGQSLVDALIYFLEKGSLPWYKSAQKTADWEKELLNSLLSKEYQFFFNWLKNKHKANPVIIRRLVAQFSDRFLEALLQKLNPGINDAWESIYGDLTFIVQYFGRQGSAVLKEMGQSDSKDFYARFQKPGIRNTIWQYTLQIMLDVKDDDDAVVKILKLLSTHFGILAGDITAGDEKIVMDRLKTSTIQTAFKELSSFLKQENNNVDNTENVVNTDVANQSQIKKPNPVFEGKDPLYVNNCGIVLLHPFLKAYFVDLEIWADNKFIDDDARGRAVLLLYYLCTGETEVAEFDLALQKILCGYPMEDTLPASLILSEKEIAETEKLLNTVTNYWGPLKNTSVQGLRNTFLQREGKLELRENGWLLTVEQKTVDILLGKLPWGFSTIRLPWMQDMLSVDWC